MNKLSILLSLGAWLLCCDGNQPFMPPFGTIPFLTYFRSQYRGLCVGVLVSRTAVLTAAICVTNPKSEKPDTRAINVVTAANYRHQRRGIRVQVTKILLPKFLDSKVSRGILIEKSPAILLLKRVVPDVLAEIPLRASDIDFKGEEVLSLQQECLVAGWHFFYNGDTVHPVQKFLLQKNLRIQFLNIVKKELYCEALLLKFQKAMADIGQFGQTDDVSSICLKDADHTAQPCHGMYGAPVICGQRVVGMMMAPDAQWTNCTGLSNIFHLFNAEHLRNFMQCTQRLFKPEYRIDWHELKKKVLYEDVGEQEYDYIPEIYDKVLSQSSSSEEA